MKKILMILKTLPYPIHRDGLSVINYHLLKFAPSDYTIDIISLDKDDVEVAKCVKRISTRINNIDCYQSNKKQNSFIRLVRLLMSVFKMNKLKKIFFIKIKKSAYPNYDCIYICTPPSALYYPDLNFTVPVFLNAVDSFAMLNKRFYNNKKNILLLLKTKLYQYAEKNVNNKVEVVNLVSSIDKEYAVKHSGAKNIINISNGVDVSYFKYDGRSRDCKSLLFVGNFEYKANVDAVYYFYNEIFPSIKLKHPTVKLYIVGKNSNFTIENDSVIVTGFIEDLREYYNSCTIFISPLRTGAGIKNKVLEAMSCSIPIVTTSLGIDGIDGVEDRTHVFVSDDSKSMINSILFLFENEKIRQTLSDNSRSLIENSHSWKQRVDEYYKTINLMIN